MDEQSLSLVRDVGALAEFAAVARWEHVTRAAEELGVPQPTLSRRIARLEAAVGVPLFVRRGRRLETTRAGRELAVVVERTLGELERGLADVRRSADPAQGSVALAFLNTLGVAVVPHLLREFGDHHPGITFRLAQDGHEVAVSRLRTGEVDLCLTSPLPQAPDLASRPLHRQPLRLVVPSGHRLAGRRRVALATTADQPHVGFKVGIGMRGITEEWCHRAGFSPRLAFEGEDVATVRGLVAAGLGVALLPASAPPAPGTEELALTDVDPSRTIGVVVSAIRPLPAPARIFHDFLLEHGPRVARLTM